MKIRLVAFASASEALGTSEMEVELAPGADLAGLRRQLEEQYPDLAPLWPRLALAIDGVISGPDSELRPGCEVALLPPVSGGAPSAVRVDEQPIDAASLLAAVEAPSRGAVTLFLGVVRDHHADQTVAGITYHAYHRMALDRLDRIVTELEADADDLRLAIHHRTGRLAPGVASVGIAAASPHRDAAYEASRLALERLKREVPVWKQEHYGNGAHAWREEEPLEPADRS